MTIGGAPNPTTSHFSNVAQGNIEVKDNTGGATSTLTDNRAGGNCQLSDDQPPISGQDNVARGRNRCNQSA